MKSFHLTLRSQPRRGGFTLVEMLVVIAIMSILMTAGAIGLGGIGGKGVTSGVATAESLFDEARTIAISRKLRTCVLVSENLTTNPSMNLKWMAVAVERTEEDSTDPRYGMPLAGPGTSPDWVIASRGITLPDQTFFSKEFSRGSGADPVETIGSDRIRRSGGAGIAPGYEGNYYVYEFNGEGISSKPGSTFVIGAGVRSNSATDAPKVTANGKSDFGGFTIWRNGQTSIFRSPTQIDPRISTLRPGQQF